MRFCNWYPADEIVHRAPESPGVFQVRAPTVLDYPTGRSAMVHYGHANDLRAALRQWASESGRDGWLYRHADARGLENPAQAAERLSERFRARFGACPRTPGRG